MIAKGLDFQGNTCRSYRCRSTSKDGGFSCIRKSFQMLVQVSGRAGRGNRQGKYIFKLMHPIHLAFNMPQGNLKGFVEEEMEMRREFNYPPYRHLIRHLFRSRSEAKVEFYTNKWSNLINENKVDNITIKNCSTPLKKSKDIGVSPVLLYRFSKSIA